MQISYKKNDNSLSNIEVIVEKNDVKNKLEEKKRKIHSQIKIDGFRKGKIPANIVDNIFEEEVFLQIAFDFAVDKIQSYITLENILHFSPFVVNEKKVEGDIFKIEVSIDSFSPVKVENLENFTQEVSKLKLKDLEKNEVKNELLDILFDINKLKKVEKVNIYYSIVFVDIYFFDDKGKKKFLVEKYNINLNEEKIFEFFESKKINEELKFTFDQVQEMKHYSVFNIVNHILDYKNQKKEIESLPKEIFIRINEIKELSFEDLSVQDLSNYLNIKIEEDKNKEKEEMIFEISKNYINGHFEKILSDLNISSIIELLTEKYKIEINRDCLLNFIKFEKSNKYFSNFDQTLEEILENDEILKNFEKSMKIIVIVTSFISEKNIKIDQNIKNKYQDKFLNLIISIYRNNFPSDLEGRNFNSFFQENQNIISIIFQRLVYTNFFIDYIYENFKIKEELITIDDLKKKFYQN